MDRSTMLEAIHAAQLIKHQIEIELAKAINKALQDFSERTGLAAHGVSVYLIDVTRVTDTHTTYIVDQVRIDAGNL